MTISPLFAFCLLFAQIHCAQAGKILVFPLDGSHWVNMKILVEELHAKGHEITVVRTSDSWYINEESPFYTSATLQADTGFEETFRKYMSTELEILYQSKSTSMWSRRFNDLKLRRVVVEQFNEMHKRMSEMIIQMFEDKNFMRSLQDAKYDLVLTDPGIGGGAMLARWLKVPLVYNVRWTIQGEAHLLLAPSPLSYVPFTATKFTDKMTFLQRVINIFSYTLGMYTLSSITEPHYKPVVKKYLGPDVDYNVLHLDADIWLMRTDFVFEFPRPTMPNVVYIGGFQCKPSKPLPKDLEEFVQSSGEHGVIVMTLGTLIGTLPQVVAEEIAAAFAQLPQKVLWRYIGPRPENVGNNTLVVNWLPQNDLLGHPKTRAFVSHGGTNGVQEAIYHGVPVVGIPLLYDQPDNLFKIEAKGGAVTVELSMLDRHVFKEALMSVLYDSSFRENMQRLSRLHRDQPVSPLSLAVFWIEYVMRHKGARHLQAQSINMSWFIYYSVDVIATLMTLGLLGAFFCFLFLRFLWRWIFVGKKMKKE